MIYQQFSLSMATSILFSAFFGAVVNPACARRYLSLSPKVSITPKAVFWLVQHAFRAFVCGVRALGCPPPSKRGSRYLLVYGALLVVFSAVFCTPALFFFTGRGSGYTIT